MEIGLYGNTLPITRDAGVADHHWHVIEPRLRSLQGLDARLQQPAILALRETFHLIRQVTVFVMTQFGPHRMTRSFVDTAQGHFYWHVSDLTDAGYSSPQRIMSYLLHDAQHVRQRLTGDIAKDLDSLVRREVDATDVQLTFARIASAADPLFIAFLEGYRNDREAIEKRLKTGVGFFESMFFGKPRYEEHLVIF